MMRRLLFVAAALALAAMAPLRAIDADRDFSGRWHLDTQASDLRGFEGDADRLLVVTQKEMAIECSSEEAGRWSFTADGAESRYRIGDEPRNTIGKWEGPALLLNTLVGGLRSYTIMDRWALSRDRGTLRIERQILRLGNEKQSVLIYRREGFVPQTQQTAAPPDGLTPRPGSPAPNEIVVPAGTRIPLSLVNSLSTKQTKDGDRVYLETAFPIAAGGRIVIPRGSYVIGTVTQSKKAGKVSGKAELYIRFDSLTLPNGVTRDFRSRLGSVDGTAQGEVDRTQEGKVTGEGNKSGDARSVGEGASIGAGVGGLAGAAAGHARMGAGLGAAAGAAAGLASILTKRGPDVVLPKGTTVEMVLDRDLRYKPEELIR